MLRGVEEFGSSRVLVKFYKVELYLKHIRVDQFQSSSIFGRVREEFLGPRSSLVQSWPETAGLVHKDWPEF